MRPIIFPIIAIKVSAVVVSAVAINFRKCVALIPGLAVA